MELIIILFLAFTCVNSTGDTPPEPEYVKEGREWVAKNYADFTNDLESYGSVIKYFEELKTFVQETQVKNNELTPFVNKVVETLEELYDFEEEHSTITQSTVEQHGQLTEAVNKLIEHLDPCLNSVENAKNWINLRFEVIRKNGKYMKDVRHIRTDLRAAIKSMKKLRQSICLKCMSEGNQQEMEAKIQNAINTLKTTEFIVKTQEALDKIVVLIKKIQEKEERDKKGKGILSFLPCRSCDTKDGYVKLNH